MIRKVALVHALREAFPMDLGGLYTADELGVEADFEGSAQVRDEEPARPRRTFKAASRTQEPAAPEDASLDIQPPEASDDPFGGEAK